MARPATWLKWNVGLELTDEVLQMSAQLSLPRYEVAVCLMNVWARAWRTVAVDGAGDGRLETHRTYPLELIDEWAGDRTGFGAAMARTPWLAQEGNVLVFRSWDRHNGDAALARSKETVGRRDRRARTVSVNCPEVVRANGGQSADGNRVKSSSSPSELLTHPPTPAPGGGSAAGGENAGVEAGKLAAVLVSYGAKAGPAKRRAAELLARHGSYAAAELIAHQWLAYASEEHEATGGGVGIAMNALRDGEPCPDNGRTYDRVLAVLARTKPGAKGSEHDDRGTGRAVAGGLAGADVAAGGQAGRSDRAGRDGGGSPDGGGVGRDGGSCPAMVRVSGGAGPATNGGGERSGVRPAAAGDDRSRSDADARARGAGPGDAGSDRGGAADGARAIAADSAAAGPVAGGLARDAVLPDVGGGGAAGGAGDGQPRKPLCLVRVAR